MSTTNANVASLTSLRARDQLSMRVAQLRSLFAPLRGNADGTAILNTADEENLLWLANTLADEIAELIPLTYTADASITPGV